MQLAENPLFSRGTGLGVCVFLSILTSSAAAGAAEQGVAGTKLLLKGTTKLVLIAKDTSVRLGGFDPAIGGEDSSISFSLDGGPQVTFDLPEELWKKNPAGTVFKYKNGAAPGGPSPVKLAKVRSGLIKVVARELPFAAPNGAATVDVVLRLDGGAEVYCMTFSGTGDGNKFLVLNAAAGNCPIAAPTETPTPTATATATPSKPPTCTVNLHIMPASSTVDPVPLVVTVFLVHTGCDPSVEFTFLWTCASDLDSGACTQFVDSTPVRDESPGLIMETRILHTMAFASYTVAARVEGTLPDGSVVAAAEIWSNIEVYGEF